MPQHFLWILLIGMLLMMWFVSRNWVRTIGGFYGTVVEVDGDVVTLATPLGDETLWSKRAIAAIEEPPFGSASAQVELEDDAAEQDDGARESEQDAAEPHP